MKIQGIAVSALIAAAGLCSTSCKTPQNVAYFQDATDVVSVVNSTPIKVRPDDKLSIVVKSKDAAVSDLFNLGVYTTRVGTSTNTAPSGTGTQTIQYHPGGNDGIANYTVDPQGDIDFPIIGKLHVAGMTRSELSGFIKGELMGRELVKDPVVTVEFVNTGFNIIGEVNNPGRYDMNADHLDVVEAISLAGDLTITGRRDNVKVIRDENGKKKIYTLDLTNLAQTAQSPGFSLQQDDVIYVEPNDMRKRQTTVNGNNTLSTSFWISVASLITSAVTTVGVFINK